MVVLVVLICRRSGRERIRQKELIDLGCRVDRFGSSAVRSRQVSKDEYQRTMLASPYPQTRLIPDLNPHSVQARTGEREVPPEEAHCIRQNPRDLIHEQAINRLHIQGMYVYPFLSILPLTSANANIPSLRSPFPKPQSVAIAAVAASSHSRLSTRNTRSKQSHQSQHPQQSQHSQNTLQGSESKITTTCSGPITP